MNRTLILAFSIFAFFLGAIAFRSDQKIPPPASSVQTNAVSKTTKSVPVPSPKPVEPKQIEPQAEDLKPLSELMPLWAVKSNAPNDFQITFKAYNSSEWATAPNTFQSEAEALSVIESCKARLTLQYEVGKTLSDSLGRLSGRLTGNER